MAVGTVCAGVFAVQTFRVGAQVRRALVHETETAAVQTARTVQSSIEQAMLSGNGIKVKQLVDELKGAVASNKTEIRIFDSQGVEVFAPQPPIPRRDTLPKSLLHVLDTRERISDDDGVFRGILSDDTCARCHTDKDPLRGVLGLHGMNSRCDDDRDRLLAKIVRSGFINLMTATRDRYLGEYLEDLSASAPRIVGVGGYDQEGDPSLGDDLEELVIDGVEMEPALAETVGSLVSKTVDLGTHRLTSLPLKRQPRCIECHPGTEELRGSLLVLLKKSDEKSCSTEEIEALIDTSLRRIMTSELGRFIATFLDSIVGHGGADSLVLYDRKGRVYWSTNHPRPSQHLTAALTTGTLQVDSYGAGEQERIRIIAPLPNSPRCARCHGSAMPLRGLVEVSMSTESAMRTQEVTRRSLITSSAAAMLLTLVMLVLLLRSLLVQPIRKIGDVADAVAKGNLSQQVAYANARGDEVARLGQRFNLMISELRTKFQLEKFVSKGTAEAARYVSDDGKYESKRCRATIVFSDIRGFTSYSENNSPEDVVGMLNRLLRVQADVVHEAGGDIDKFVGDELMAIFQGEEAEVRATQCALEILAAVRDARISGLRVGVGVSTGEVVLGAIGHEDRLDFTAIGDVVNVGARLCSAASGDEILVTAEVHSEVAEEFEVEALEPLPLKGKAQPLEVYRVIRRRS